MSAAGAPPAATTCLLCHTPSPSQVAGTLTAGDHWKCPRCHQSWDAKRLVTVAAYTAFCDSRTRS
jgi:hypothetical protein